jgi:hypothetical protein
MKKFLKGVLVLLALLLAGAIIVSAVGWHYLKGLPEHYKVYKWTQQQEDALNRQAEAKWVAAHNRVATAVMNERSAAKAGTTLPTLHEPITVTFSEEELNAILRQKFTEDLAKYVEDPGIYLKDGQMILAGKLKDYGYLISFYFEPKIDENGKLKLAINKILGGQLSLPRSIVDGKFEQIRASMKGKLPGWQRGAKMEDLTGASNADAVKAAMGELVMKILADEPGEAVLFLPDEHKKSYPLRLKKVEIKDEQVAMTLAPMTQAQRRELLARIRKPAESPTALTKAQ